MRSASTLNVTTLPVMNWATSSELIPTPQAGSHRRRLSMESTIKPQDLKLAGKHLIDVGRTAVRDAYQAYQKSEAEGF